MYFRNQEGYYSLVCIQGIQCDAGLDVPQFKYTISEKGWTNNTIAKNWPNKLFIPNTIPEPGDD